MEHVKLISSPFNMCRDMAREIGSLPPLGSNFSSKPLRTSSVGGRGSLMSADTTHYQYAGLPLPTQDKVGMPLTVKRHTDRRRNKRQQGFACCGRQLHVSSPSMALAELPTATPLFVSVPSSTTCTGSTMHHPHMTSSMLHLWHSTSSLQ